MTFDSREQHGLNRRKLWFALLCSLFLHGALFSLGPARFAPQESTSVSVPGLIARLSSTPVAIAPVTPVVAAGVSHAVTRLTVPPRPMPRAVTSVSPARQQSPSLKEPVAQLPASTLPMMTDALPTQQAESTESVSSVAVPGMTMSAANDQQGDQREGLKNNLQNLTSVAGLSADGLRRYRLGLATQSRRFKRYPAQALAAGWAGTVEVFLAVDSAGQAVVNLNKSSGHEALDRAAQAMIEAGARHTPIPDVLRGKAFSVVLPVVFDINDE